VSQAVSDAAFRKECGRAARSRVAYLDWTEVAQRFRTLILGEATIIPPSSPPHSYGEERIHS